MKKYTVLLLCTALLCACSPAGREAESTPSSLPAGTPAAEGADEAMPSLTASWDELCSVMEDIELGGDFPAKEYLLHVTGLSVPVTLTMRLDNVTAIAAHGQTVTLAKSLDIYGNCDFDLFEAGGAVVLEGGHYGIDDICILAPEGVSEVHPGEKASYSLYLTEDGRLRYRLTHNAIADIVQCGALSVAVSRDEFLYASGTAEIVDGQVIFAEPDEYTVMSDKYDLDAEWEAVWSGYFASAEEKMEANRAERESH